MLHAGEAKSVTQTTHHVINVRLVQKENTNQTDSHIKPKFPGHTSVHRTLRLFENGSLSLAKIVLRTLIEVEREGLSEDPARHALPDQQPRVYQEKQACMTVFVTASSTW